MSAGTNSATSDHQADAETPRHPVQDYSDAALGVVTTIAERGATHGDPEVFGVTFAAFLGAYLAPIVSGGRPVTVADAFVVLDLMKTARIAAGGPSAVHFHDKAGYAILGEVHMDRVAAAGEARRAAQASPVAPSEADSGLPGGMSEEAYQRGEPAPAGSVAQAVAAYQDQGDDDHEEAADTDLLRWALDPSLDPFADQVNFDHSLRPGVTWEQVEARRKRIVALLQMEADKGKAGRKGAVGALVNYRDMTFPPNDPKA
jgi:hypothetical protein